MPPCFCMCCSSLAAYFTPSQQAPTHPSTPKSDCPSSVNPCSNYAQQSLPTALPRHLICNTHNRHDHLWVPAQDRHLAHSFIYTAVTYWIPLPHWTACSFPAGTGLSSSHAQRLVQHPAQTRCEWRADKRWREWSDTKDEQFWNLRQVRGHLISKSASFWETPWCPYSEELFGWLITLPGNISLQLVSIPMFAAKLLWKAGWCCRKNTQLWRQSGEGSPPAVLLAGCTDSGKTSLPRAQSSQSSILFVVVRLQAQAWV